MSSPSFKRSLRIVATLFAILLVVELINIVSARSLNSLGIYPRHLIGLRGILFAPLLHGNLYHFAANILPLCVFAFLTLQYGLKRFYLVTLTIVLGTGLLVWIFGRPAMHIGASGLIYGYFGFLLLAGFLSARFSMIVISILVAFVYGGLIFGVLPTSGYVSWESHLLGFIVGLFAAKRWAKH